MIYFQAVGPKRVWSLKNKKIRCLYSGGHFKAPHKKACAAVLKHNMVIYQHVHNKVCS
tara:strand:- start:1102 stop:1275 length:174 start_codon:yes stop_codon:yes gene_type:complete